MQNGLIMLTGRTYRLLAAVKKLEINSLEEAGELIKTTENTQPKTEAKEEL